jgi:hypothetical protein
LFHGGESREHPRRRNVRVSDPEETDMTRNDQPGTSDAPSPSSLRHDLDSGRGRDKVPYPDPAAAPLGTDDEAAGTPVTEEQVRMAQRHELRGQGDLDTEAPAVVHARKTQSFDSDATLQPHAGRDAPRSASRFYIGLLVLAAIVALLFVLLR